MVEASFADGVGQGGSNRSYKIQFQDQLFLVHVVLSRSVGGRGATIWKCPGSISLFFGD